MRLLAISLSIGISAALTNTAHADFADGNKLNDLCKNSNTSEYVVCAGYVMGVLDAITSLQHARAIEQKLCAPTNLSGVQVAEMVKKHLKDNPQLWHHNAFSIVANLFVGDFPCKK